jgi:hypothetical protein
MAKPAFYRHDPEITYFECLGLGLGRLLLEFNLESTPPLLEIIFLVEAQDGCGIFVARFRKKLICVRESPFEPE